MHTKMYDTIMERGRYEKAQALGSDLEGLMLLHFEPAPMDVVCGRGCTNAIRPGNKFFSATVEAHLQEYRNARNRADKSLVVTAVMEQMQYAGSRFLKMDKATNRWKVLTRQEAHNKTGHAIRDMIRVTILPDVSGSRAGKVSPKAASHPFRSHSEETRKKPPPKPNSSPQRSRSLTDMLVQDAFQLNETYDDTRSSFVTSASLLETMFAAAGELQDVGESPEQHTTNSIHGHLQMGSRLINTFDETPIPLEVPYSTQSDEMVQPVSRGTVFGDVVALLPRQRKQQDRTMDPSCSPITKRRSNGGR